MTIEAQYAKALFDLVQATPEKSGDYRKGLTETLEKKGHQKLLPRILAEYQTIVERKERSANYRKVTPESERSRVLVELYRTLVATQ